ncbi:MAG: VPLPA-CTERM sorting domain-containing protein [Pseudomonadota bacterium]
MRVQFIAACMAAALTFPMSASAVTTAGPGGFDNGYATAITFDPSAARGTSNNRADPLNALGSPDGDFFEIGTGSTIDLTFGTLFDTSATIFEVTFGSASRFPESAKVEVGLGGTFESVGSITNVAAQGGGVLTIAGLTNNVFDTLRIIDTSSQRPGGFDVDAVRVSPVPIPAAALFLLTALGGFGLIRRLGARG